ncbi:MAG TPA: TAT-variant-translocated molybdopterin oxidoreductase [Candidatus Methylacidiphilales bacterium]|nr:TAT-variant-translocated molybdopterin oxidoreductase [Candidatus Methylacidiphilales bacterium]
MPSMKREFHHPPEPKSGRKYWRSVEELANTPGFQEQLKREFPQGAAELEGDEVSRRGFMKFMGASLALAGIGLTGCRRPLLQMVPFSKGVEWEIPGNALHYATAMPRRNGALPLVATCYNGRPTKLEGNPTVPGFTGSTDHLGQAAILDLYDPDRSKAILNAVERGSDYSEQSWDDFWKNGFPALTQAFGSGQGVAILAEPSISPTRERLRGEVQKKLPQLVWAEYEPWSADMPITADLSKADVILSLDSDFLGASEGSVQNIAGFAAGRRRLGKTQETMSRLYVVESRFTITGGMADHRLRMASSNIGNVATTLAAKLGVGGGGSFAAPASADVDAWLTACAADLQNAKGRAFVFCGSQQPAAVQQLVAQINDALGARGTVYQERFVPKVAAATIADLATQITAGTIKTLIVLGGNPAFNAPAELGFTDLLNKVPQVIRHGLYVDETSATSTIHLPAAHFLEYWGDNISHGTTIYLCQQPMILPLYNGISELDLLAALAGLPPAKGAELVQETFTALTSIAPGAGQAFDDAWRQFVHDGFYSGGISLPMAVNSIEGFMAQSAAAAAAVPGQGGRQAAGKPLGDGEYELVFSLGLIDDGRYANNGWLQELPDPVSRLTWDNVLYMSPKTADALGIKVGTSNDNFSDLPNTDVNPRKTPIGIIPHVDMLTAFPMAEITLPDGKTTMQLPVLIAPGQADATLSIALGWGRTAPRLTKGDRDVVTPPLRVAEGAGFNAYALRTSTTPGFVTGVKVKKLDTTYPLAISQMHNSMEGRGLVREAPLDLYHQDPAFVQKIGTDKDTPQGELTGYQNYESGYPNPPLNSKTYQPDRPAWGMVIDLNTCVGCNSCVIACQAENNIPIVGKFQVIRGREMHWIRIDRYFASDNPPQEDANGENQFTSSDYLDDPQMLIQPMACQQCENAPCEPVCPVNATVHNEEGLNVMAYNRCIGTRYCANNCPYKVRRFNFFNYNDRPIGNVKLPVLGVTNELYLGPFAGRDGPLTYKGSPESLMLQKNPNVSVRIRGVMEKCTYCVQRIEEAKITQLRHSNNDGQGSGDITLPTDSFQVACQQVCPAEAITFGNLNDDNSKVSILKQDDRNYGVLAYLDTRPRTSYLGRVRNPNPAMPDGAFVGNTSIFEKAPGQEKDETNKPAVSAPPAGDNNHVDLKKLNPGRLIG